LQWIPNSKFHIPDSKNFLKVYWTGFTPVEYPKGAPIPQGKQDYLNLLFSIFPEERMKKPSRYAGENHVILER